MAEQKDSIEQFGSDPAGIVRRWITELDFAEKRDKDWVKTAKRIMDIYRGKNRKRNSFNILYSNTETLAAAIYNAPPKPDVRRRYKDADPVGKEVSKVLERALEFSIDSDCFSQSLTEDVLDLLLPGRGVSRVRYIPSFLSTEGVEEDSDADDDYEELAWQQAAVDHVNWEDFRQGPGRTWKEVCWVAFRHRMGREDLVEKFGAEIGNAIPLDSIDTDDSKSEQARNAEVFKTAEVWEIWDKDTRKVLFIAQGYKAAPCLELEDPLRLIEFFPCPRPIRAVADSSSQEIIPLYEQYREQASELDKISTRINKIIDALKVRGIYDSTMTDLAQLMRGDDNDLIAAQNVSAWIERGGIEKAIWMMPIEGPAKVLQVLYMQRDASKQVIYEITGISDVMRAVSNPNETLGAQKMKAQFGGQRINRLQAEVQRYARDLIRLMSEIIAEKFEPETLMKMTGTKYPTQAEVQAQTQQMMAQWQQAAQMAQQQGQQPPPQPQPPQVVTIEQLMAILRDDVQRMFRIDVETDSMIAAAEQEDADEINKLATGVINLMGGLTQVVQTGAMPIESAKEIILSITRRAKMGTAVEDAIDKLQMPNPPPDPNAGKAEAEQAKMQVQMQIEKAKMESQMQLENMKAQLQDQQHQRQLAADAQAAQMQAQLDAQLQANEQRVQAEQNAHQNQLESERAQMQAQIDSALEQQRIASDERIVALEQQFSIIIQGMKDNTALEVAQIGQQTTLSAAQIGSAKAGSE
jgi:hypothetical protein